MRRQALVKPGRNEQVPPIRFREEKRLVEFRQIPFEQLQHGESKSVHCCGIYIRQARKIISVLGNQP